MNSQEFFRKCMAAQEAGLKLGASGYNGAMINRQDGEAQAYWQSQSEWLKEMCAKQNIPNPN